MFPFVSPSQIDAVSPAVPYLPIRALLLDDNRFDQRRIERMAKDSGLMISIDIAANLAAMSECLEHRDYDVAFLDYRLPIGSGCDAVELLRDNQSNTGCATIMVAGDVLLDQTAQTMRDACDSFISKDELSPDMLRKVVTSILNEQAFSKPADEAATEGATDAISSDVEVEIEALIRDVRHLRTARATDALDLTAALSQIECRSIRIWSETRAQMARLVGQDARFDVFGAQQPNPNRAH